MALVVHVEEAFMHCAKALIRSGIWRSESWPERRSALTLAEWQVEVVEDGRTFDEVFAVHTDDEKHDYTVTKLVPSRDCHILT